MAYKYIRHNSGEGSVSLRDKRRESYTRPHSQAFCFEKMLRYQYLSTDFTQ